MNIDTTPIERSITVLQTALDEREQCEPDSIESRIYGMAAIKEFEVALGQCSRQLRVRLRDYLPKDLQVERLAIKSAFRHAAKIDLIDYATSERWCKYREVRNDMVEGENVADDTLDLLPGFVEDARALVTIIAREKGARA